MFESTNAVIGALFALFRELHRCEQALQGGTLDEAAEEALGPLVDQMHEALADLSEVYNTRRATQPQLLDLDALRARALGG